MHKDAPAIRGFDCASSRRLLVLNSNIGRAGRAGRGSVVFFLLLCLCAPFGSAQVSATLFGIVTDQSGAAVTAAAVTAHNLDTGFSRSTVTDQSGRYHLFALPVGQYEVRAKKGGFAEGVRTGIRLVVGQDASVDLSLRLGPVSEELRVTGDAALVSVTTPGHLGISRRATGERPSAQRTELRSAAHVESGHRQLHGGEDRGDRSIEFHHRKQFFGLWKPAAAKPVSAERCRVHGRGGK